MMNRESISVDITLYSTDESLPLPRTPYHSHRHTVNVQYESIFIVRHISSLSTNFQRSLTANILNAYGKSISPSCQKTTAWSTFCVCTQTLHTFKLLLYSVRRCRSSNMVSDARFVLHHRSRDFHCVEVS